MAESVDARDLKSLVRKDVPVRVRLRAPIIHLRGAREVHKALERMGFFIARRPVVSNGFH